MTANQSLRTDERQWLIYDDESLGAVMRGLEAWALKIAAQLLMPNRVDGLRGVGHFMDRVADARLRHMKKNGGAQEVVADWILLISRWAAGKSLETPEVTRALDEIYAATTRLDSRAMSAGIVGPGTHRIAVRGD